MAHRLDPFMLLMFGAIAAASFWPAAGAAAQSLDAASALSVALLFFLHGAAIAPGEIRKGLAEWRLHALIFSLTFVAFPALVLPVTFGQDLIPPGLVTGFLFLGALPSAVSSSIAYTSMARGNVPGAICSAAASNVFGLVLTPVLMSVFLQVSTSAEFEPLEALKDVAIQLLLPFAAGQAIRPILASWLDRRTTLIERYDQAVIVLVIYVAFSKSVLAGIWSEAPIAVLSLTAALCIVLLGAIFVLAMAVSRRLGLTREDEIAAVFCGSKKSLASGLPLAQVLFAGSADFGLIILPIMLYNQLQIVAGAIAARRYAARLAA